MADQMGPSVAGGWLGTYYYDKTGAGQPVRFEATLQSASTEGSFTGTILDDSQEGEAGVSGYQSGLRVKFTKVYMGAAPAARDTGPVEYDGAIEPDGKEMKGTWRLIAGPVEMRGGWEARRAWSSEQTEIQVPESESAREEVYAAMPAPASSHDSPG